MIRANKTNGSTDLFVFGKEGTALETAKRTYDDTEIDLMEILQVILSKWIPIVVIGLVAAILTGVVTAFFITKKYFSASILTVTSEAPKPPP